MAKKDKSKIEFTLQNYNDYKIHKDPIFLFKKNWKFLPGKKIVKTKM
jgi:hypothetical protein